VPGGGIEYLLVKPWSVLFAGSKLNRVATATDMVNMAEMTVQPLKGA